MVRKKNRTIISVLNQKLEKAEEMLPLLPLKYYKFPLKSYKAEK